jgi:hypothetical protein
MEFAMRGGRAGAQLPLASTFKQREIENSKGYFWKYKTSKMKKPKGRKD